MKIPLYLGFVREEGILIPAFMSVTKESAGFEAKRHVDDALPNNHVEVYKILFDSVEHHKAVITVVWTPEGEEVRYHD